MRNKGFTLIELMIVVVIIGILAAIAIPNFMRMRDRAREASTEANMHTVQLNAEEFSTLADGCYPQDLDVTVSDVLDDLSYDSSNSSSLCCESPGVPPYTDGCGHMLPEAMKNPFLPSLDAVRTTNALGGGANDRGVVAYYPWGGTVGVEELYYSIRGGDRNGNHLLLCLTSGQ